MNAKFMENLTGDYIMTFEEITDLCEEILHLNYILDEAHHITNYELEKVRLEFYNKLVQLEIALKYLTETSGFKAQMVSDIIVIKGEVQDETKSEHNENSLKRIFESNYSKLKILNKILNILKI